MQQQASSSFRRPVLGLIAVCGLAALSGGGRAAARAAAPTTAPASVGALVYSTMPSTAAHRPEMALDGDQNTYFKSAYGVGSGDDFLVLLARPIPVDSLQITTGDTDGLDRVTNGFVETSPDGVTFRKAAAFTAGGIADAACHGAPVQALRIQVNRGSGLPSLLIREITIRSSVKIGPVLMGPGRGFVDISQAPDLADWARRAENEMEAFWPDTAAILYTDKFITPNMVNVVYRTGPGVTDVAATGGGVMTVNSKWCREHPDDTGLTVHEMAHVVQSMSAYNPVWLIEGIADYIRWVKFEPENFHPRISPEKSTYHDAYRTTATFLAWCALHYDSGLVTKLNRAIRYGTYSNDLFTKYCGKDVDALWSEFVAAYKADPVGIITPPIAPADRPRPLPVVKAGTGVPVPLSMAFNTVGIYRDGATFAENDGVDGGGAAYSADLLGPARTWKQVPFRLGPAGAADIVTSHGQVIPLTGGSYTSLWLLGTAVDGSQHHQTFIVTYADGTTQTLAQNLSDWFEPQGFPGESRAVPMAYRTQANGEKDPRTFYAYSYGFPLDSTKPVKSITLPDNENVKLLAITLAN